MLSETARFHHAARRRGGGMAVAALAEQPPRKRPLLAYLITGTRDGLAFETLAFLNRLRDLGYIDGQNIDIVTRYADSP